MLVADLRLYCASCSTAVPTPSSSVRPPFVCMLPRLQLNHLVDADGARSRWLAPHSHNCRQAWRHQQWSRTVNDADFGKPAARRTLQEMLTGRRWTADGRTEESYPSWTRHIRPGMEGCRSPPAVRSRRSVRLASGHRTETNDRAHGADGRTRLVPSPVAHRCREELSGL